ncbi:MAG: hypothetical protein DCF20_19715 [Pseudanabaena sp.]|nr:MAG: hypothetical protein DCF20_19715 [Pseudanabaena sp.]
MGEIVGLGLGETVGNGLVVVVFVGVGVDVGETFVESFAGIEKLLLPELLQAVNKPVAIAVSNKIDSL